MQSVISRQKKRILFLLYIMPIVFLSGAFSTIHSGPEDIRLNQIGFFINSPKIAIVLSPNTWYFSIKSPDLASTFYTGELSAETTWSYSGETLKVADFSHFRQAGDYVLFVEGIGSSYPFRISDDVFLPLSKGLLKAFYYQRASTSLSKEYAGKWSRTAGHPDREVIIHPSAASDPAKEGARTAGQTYPSPKGWYDAGDYGKYVVNAGITTYQLLLLFQIFPEYFSAINLNLPESDNMLPDILDEIKWELDWLLTMQDPADGGVYHKLTNKIFIGDLSPAAANETRYFIGKGAAATFDFAAVCAKAYCIYNNFLPEFADSCLAAAQYAWTWGIAYPDSTFQNPDDVVTGEYGDTQTDDEYLWAAFELFNATKDSSYYFARKNKATSAPVPSWPNVAMLGFYSLALSLDDSASKSSIIKTADGLLKRTQTLPYRSSIQSEFYWGSNGVVANQGMNMLIAYLLTKNTSYLEGAIHSCDYLLGRNATGYCFVTGYGYKKPMHPHHRPSTADNIAEPIPGLLVGGPNSQSRNGENCSDTYPAEKAKAYLDNDCSFTTNEVAINWNAPAAFLAGGIDAILNSGKYDLHELASRYSDTLPPHGTIFSIVNISSDRATVKWQADEYTTVSVAYSTTTTMAGARRRGFPQADSGSVELQGLLPGHLYYTHLYCIDNNGNRSEASDTFRTKTSDLYLPSLYEKNSDTYSLGTSPEISFEAPDGINARCAITTGGSTLSDTLPFVRLGSALTLVIPPGMADSCGTIYSILLNNDSSELITPPQSFVPSPLVMTTESFALNNAYKMVSVPGRHLELPSIELFGSAFGDTSAWRYYGHDPRLNEYIPFDFLKAGRGGWLYHETGSLCTITTEAVPPDSLFPVLLNKKWNCIGNPFTFPIVWDNSMVDDKGALLKVTEATTQRLLRRQFFTYSDTTPDTFNNGYYSTNRELSSHVYNDTALFFPWNAYWIYAERDSVTLLLNPSPVRSNGSVGKKHASNDHFWFVALSFTADNSSGAPLAFGCSDHASSDYDEFDTPKLPSFSPYIEAAFIQNSTQGAPKSLSADIRGYPVNGVHTWPLTIVTDSKRKTLLLQWTIKGAINGTLLLRDDLTGDTIDMLQRTMVELKDPSKERRSVSFIWSQNLMKEAVLPSRWNVSVKTGTRCVLSYTVPFTHTQNSFVTVAIFDIHGRKIRSLVNDRLVPGFHSAIWNRRTDAGGIASCGYYIARISCTCHATSAGFQIVR